MLVIRQEQMAVFEEHFEQQRIAKLVTFVRARWIGLWDIDVARERIRNALTRARQHGLQWELSLADFVLMDLTFGAEFDRDTRVAPAFAALAASPEPDTAFFLLASKVPLQVWNELRSAAVINVEA